MPVIAVGTVEEAFFGAIKALNWAGKISGTGNPYDRDVSR
ncbi:MAG: hypothetical protein CM1200mP35_05940 [Chloroflexota bacterium]|nr:MAG: hypothetical protein CM1200mP35_05940 [Chloroflexota bacterium]